MNWRFHLFFFFLWGAGSILVVSHAPHLFRWFSLSFLGLWLILPLRSAWQTFRFSRKTGVGKLPALGYAFIAFFHHHYFLWGIRPTLPLSEDERQKLLKESSRLTKVSVPSSFLCPFCNVEIPQALKTLPQGSITTRKIPLLCPRCKTRFDVCRYCRFFEPRNTGIWAGSLESGKCTTIKKVQQVEEVCDPSVAKRLKAMGWLTLHTGIPVTDSFHRPEECRFFQFDETKTIRDSLPCMGKIRYLLLKIEEDYSHSSSGSRSS